MGFPNPSSKKFVLHILPTYSIVGKTSCFFLQGAIYYNCAYLNRDKETNVKRHINRLFSMYPENIARLEDLKKHFDIKKSAIIRKLIDEKHQELVRDGYIPTDTQKESEQVSPEPTQADTPKK